MNDKLLLGIYGIHDISSGDSSRLIHDHNLSLLSNNAIECYIHLERITRNKYDANLAREIEGLVRKMKIAGESNVELCFVDHEIGKAFLSSGGQIRFEADSWNDPIDKLNTGRAYWFGKQVPGYWMSHELAHICSCIPFYGNFKEGSLLIHYDGGASLSNFSAWKYAEGQIEKLDYHNRLRKFTSFFNANALVFKLTGTEPSNHYSVPGKFMGLAAYGNYRPELEKWLEKHSYFGNMWNSQTVFLRALKADWGIELKQIDNRNSFMQDIAATLHELFVRESAKEILSIAADGNYKYLYYTGGCALNIKLNSTLLNSGVFNEIFIPPCTNDSGLSLGAASALALHHNYTVPHIGPYLNGYSHASGQRTDYTEDTLIQIAKMLSEGKIVAIANSFGEAGPRALGNRSILCRADSPQLASRLSQECKGREWYRPLAPVMLEGQARIYTGKEKFPQAASLMLFEFPILEKFNKLLSGVVHTDGSSRIQVVSNRNENPFLFDLLQVCLAKFELGALINTSFNKKGEPIVQTHEDARKSAYAMNLDALVLEGKLEILV